MLTLKSVYIVHLLIFNSYQNQTVLNNWLEQLRQRNASDSLLYVLSILFDDKIAKQILTVIYNRQTKEIGKTE